MMRPHQGMLAAMRWPPQGLVVHLALPLVASCVSDAGVPVGCAGVAPSLTHVGQISGREAESERSPIAIKHPTTNLISHRRRPSELHLQAIHATALTNVCHSTGHQRATPCPFPRRDFGSLRPVIQMLRSSAMSTMAEEGHHSQGSV
jgi:hypothetical protein